MNIKKFIEASDKFPKSRELLISTGMVKDGCERDLYDFFDEQGIHIESRWLPGDEFVYAGEEFEADEDEDDFSFTKSFYEAAIYLEGNEASEEKFISSPCKTRAEAETEVYLRAFEILESKLN